MTRAAQLAGAGAALCALAAAFAAPELYVPGLSLLLVAVVAPTWVALGTAGARLELRASTAVVQEGDRVTISLRASRGLRLLPGARLVLEPRGSALDLATVRRGADATVALPRRGRRALGPARLTLGDPFGVCRRELRSNACEILVLPRVHVVTALADGALVEAPGRRVRALAPGGDVDSLRPYRPGSPASRIHWATVARTGELVELRLAAETDRRPLVAVDARSPASDADLDRALRAAASLCLHLARRGGCDLLLPGDRRPTAIDADLRPWPIQHARLAEVDAASGAPGLTRAAAGGTVLWVTAAAPATAGVPPGCWRVGPRPIERLTVAFSVAGCAAQLVPGGVEAVPA